MVLKTHWQVVPSLQSPSSIQVVIGGISSHVKEVELQRDPNLHSPKGDEQESPGFAEKGATQIPWAIFIIYCWEKCYYLI